MTDITVDKATIALALEAIELNWRTDEGDAVTPILRAALAEPAPVQEPVAEIYAPSYLPRAIGLRFTHYGTTLPAGTKLYAAPVREPAPMSIPKGYKIVPIKAPEDALKVARSAYSNSTVYDVAHVWHSIINALPDEPAPVLEKKGLFVDLIAQHPGLAAELAAMDAPAPVQEPIGWSITCNGGHTGNFFPYRETAEATLIELNRKYPTDKRTIEPLFAAQPRKAVKLSDSEILAALEVEYVSSAQNRHLFLSDARTIEAAVLKANGVEP